MSNATYQSWHDMMRRCYEPSVHNYSRYGGRGIVVCPRWHDFDNFYSDMGFCRQGLSLERKDNNGNYEPNNCCWLPKAQQAWNRWDSITDSQVDAVKALRARGYTIYQIRDVMC